MLGDRFSDWRGSELDSDGVGWEGDREASGTGDIGNAASVWIVS